MRVLDIFCGAGGLSYGFESAGFQIALGVDMNQAALETFAANHQGSDTLCGDITSPAFKEEIIGKSLKLGIRGILGGPPCQGFSLKGKKLGLQDSRNFLFLEYLDLVRAIKPDFVVMENVKALIHTANGYFLEQIRESFKHLGLNLSVAVLNATDYGVPQRRQRVFFVGTKKGEFDFQTIATSPTPTVRDAISDLAFCEYASQGAFEQDYPMPPQSTYQALMRQNSHKLFNHQPTAHSKVALYKLSLIPPEGDKSHLPPELHGRQQFKTTWARLKWDFPSPTIDTRFDTPSNGQNSHPVLNRAITPREAARLQSFPDSFIFHGGKTQVCRQIGNAVPPLLAHGIAQALKSFLG